MVKPPRKKTNKKPRAIELRVMPTPERVAKGDLRIEEVRGGQGQIRVRARRTGGHTVIYRLAKAGNLTAGELFAAARIRSLYKRSTVRLRKFEPFTGNRGGRPGDGYAVAALEASAKLGQIIATFAASREEAYGVWQLVVKPHVVEDRALPRGKARTLTIDALRQALRRAAGAEWHKQGTESG